MMSLFRYAILLALAMNAMAATLCDSGAKATCPTSDAPDANCRIMNSTNCLKVAPTGGYHRYARIQCPFTCMKLLGMVTNTEEDKTKPPKWECKGNDHTNWLKPYALNDIDALGVNQTARCEAKKGSLPDPCKDCDFGYTCTKTCKIDVSPKNGA